MVEEFYFYIFDVANQCYRDRNQGLKGSKAQPQLTGSSMVLIVSEAVTQRDVLCLSICPSVFFFFSFFSPPDFHPLGQGTG